MTGDKEAAAAAGFFFWCVYVFIWLGGRARARIHGRLALSCTLCVGILCCVVQSAAVEYVLSCHVKSCHVVYM